MARRIATFNAYRSYQTLTRVLLAVCVGLLMVVIALASALVCLMPLKKVQPMLLTVSDQKNQIVKVEPFERSRRGRDLLSEKMAMRYVQLRETFDFVTDQSRIEQLQYLSTDTLFQAWWRLMTPKNPQSPRHTFFKNRTTRSVKIKTCLSLAPAAPNTYRVEWESIDMQDEQEVSRQEWVSTLAVTYEEREVSYEDQYINPVGFTVTHYALAKKEL